jgi:nanoRNase/pAp phosphatase (c-di-AMP/oligoRNAs hydrolase)
VTIEATRHGVEKVAEASAAERRFRAFLDFARGVKHPLIQLQHNPDPDALASGFALKHLFKRILRVDATMAFTGSVGRAENRAMMRYLRIQIVPAYKVQYSHHDLVIVVDTSPGTGTCRLPEGVSPDVVVDHHPGVPAANGPVRFSMVDVTYGATSTLVGEMLLANGIPIPVRVATALAYGIETDTQGLARNVGPVDERVFAALYAMADKRLLARIQRARVPQEYFQALEHGLARAQIHGDAISTYLGEIEHPDIVAEVADLLFRLEGMRWAIVTGIHGHVLYASLRALDVEGNDAGAVARQVAEPKGSGGGHEALAAAQIPVPPDRTSAEAHADVLARFLAAVGGKRPVTRQLTTTPPPPDAPPVTG